MSNITVQHNFVTQFTADNVVQTGGTYNFTDNTPPPPPVGRLTSAVVTWSAHPSFSQSTDLTFYKNCAGVVSPHTPPVDWPYLSGPTFKWNMPAGKYVAFQINVPAAGFPMSNHMVKGGSYTESAPMRISLSANPGDFNPATALKVIENVSPEGGESMWFRNGPGTAFYIGLSPGNTYYLNVEPMDGSRQQVCGLATQ